MTIITVTIITTREQRKAVAGSHSCPRSAQTANLYKCDYQSGSANQIARPGQSKYGGIMKCLHFALPGPALMLIQTECQTAQKILALLKNSKLIK